MGVLLDVNGKINKGYKDLYNGVSSKSNYMKYIMDLCGRFPDLSDEASLWPFESVYGKEAADEFYQSLNEDVETLSVEKTAQIK